MTYQLPEISLELPCSGSLLPTKAEYVQFYNDIAMIPSKLKASMSTINLEKIKEDKRKQLEEELKTRPDIDIDAEIQKELDKYLEQFAVIEDIIKQVEDFMALQEDLLSPWWQNGQIRNWQKEANDAWSELIDEFHMYIPTKILELISTVIPIEFTVTVMGIEVDLLRVLEKEEQERLKKQITNEVDKYYALVPEGYQYYKGEFGIECDEWKGKLTWAYFKNELVKWCTNLLQAAFGALIDAFKEIWDTLGLPSLPALLEFDVETFIRAQIDAFKEQALGELASLEAQLEQLKVDVETLAEDAKKDAEEKIAKLEDDIVNFTINGFIVDQLKDVSLFGMSLLDIIGGDIETNVLCPEDQINELVRAARDWFAQWQKELIFMWIKKIKSFLDAIGLGAILDLLTITFCDFLKLIGVPMSIDLTLPELPQIDVAVSV